MADNNTVEALWARALELSEDGSVHEAVLTFEQAAQLPPTPEAIYASSILESVYLATSSLQCWGAPQNMINPATHLVYTLTIALYPKQPYELECLPA